ncbi:hypothetical protein G6F22_019919 [Rhizopus arrhizus]|nr:hypothetical protein G6F22_019919 [Rhizopus arrhizus]
MHGDRAPVGRPGQPWKDAKLHSQPQASEPPWLHDQAHCNDLSQDDQCEGNDGSCGIRHHPVHGVRLLPMIRLEAGMDECGNQQQPDEEREHPEGWEGAEYEGQGHDSGGHCWRIFNLPGLDCRYPCKRSER